MKKTFWCVLLITWSHSAYQEKSNVAEWNGSFCLCRYLESLLSHPTLGVIAQESQNPFDCSPHMPPGAKSYACEGPLTQRAWRQGLRNHTIMAALGLSSFQNKLLSLEIKHRPKIQLGSTPKRHRCKYFSYLSSFRKHKWRWPHTKFSISLTLAENGNNRSQTWSPGTVIPSSSFSLLLLTNSVRRNCLYMLLPPEVCSKSLQENLLGQINKE